MHEPPSIDQDRFIFSPLPPSQESVWLAMYESEQTPSVEKGSAQGWWRILLLASDLPQEQYETRRASGEHENVRSKRLTAYNS